MREGQRKGDIAALPQAGSNRVDILGPAVPLRAREEPSPSAAADLSNVVPFARRRKSAEAREAPAIVADPATRPAPWLIAKQRDRIALICLLLDRGASRALCLLRSPAAAARQHRPGIDHRRNRARREYARRARQGAEPVRDIERGGSRRAQAPGSEARNRAQAAGALTRAGGKDRRGRNRQARYQVGRARQK